MRGGTRTGAGRPKQEEKRKACTMRAYPDEWDIIQAFARIVKHGDREACEAFVEKYKTK